MLIISPRGLASLVEQPRAYYLDVRTMLTEGQRGHTPFTPAAGVLLQLNARLEKLTKEALKQECDHAREMASYFREHIAPLPLRLYSQHMPNAMTALQVADARAVIKSLAQDYSLSVGSNDGELGDTVFRVAHMGHLNLSDFNLLIAALWRILT